jgi:cytochrome c-type biogenesis protein CcmH
MTAIRGMVAGLAERLKTQPDDPQGWVKLVRAYAVLGEAAPRDAALKAARARYAGKADILNALDAAARAEPLR